MGRKRTKHLNLPPRMHARVQRSGKVYYYYDQGGKPRREIPLGPDFVMAVKRWSELEMDRGSPHVDLITFRYAAERYVREVLPTKAPRTQSDNLKELDWLYRFFDNPPAPLDQIQPVNIRQYMKWRVQEVQNRMREQGKEVCGDEGQVRANREKALFSHIFNMAREWGLTNQSNPCQGVKGYSESGRADVYIEDSVFQAVWKVADQPTRDALDLAYLTGQRPADTLKCDERDIRDGVLYVRQNKTSRKLRILIEGELAAVIKRIRARKRGYKVSSTALIVNENGEQLTREAFRYRFDKARRLAGVVWEEFQFRDIRAKAATDTEDLAHAQKLLGHASREMTEHYVRPRRGELIKPTK